MQEKDNGRGDRFGRRHTDATLRLCQRLQLTLPPLNWLTWPTIRPSINRWEAAADIQTGEQYSSTRSMNAQKHLATTATSRKTLIAFLEIPTLLEAEAAMALTLSLRPYNNSTINNQIKEQGLNRTRTKNKHPPRLALIHQHTPPTAPIADYSQVIIQ